MTYLPGGSYVSSNADVDGKPALKGAESEINEWQANLSPTRKL